MKKNIIIFLISILCLMQLPAVTGTGYGRTEEEALSNSRQDLVQSFSMNVASIVYTEDYDNGAGAASMSLTNLSLQTTTFDLLGKKEEIDQLEDGSYWATTTIDSDSIPHYKALINDLVQTINSINRIIDNAEAKADEKDSYLRLIIALKEFELYRMVLIQLDPSYNPPTLNISRGAVEAEYQSLLKREQNQTETTIYDLQQQQTLGILSLDAEEQLRQAQARLEENRKARQELEAAAEADFKAQREQFNQEMQAMTASLMESLDRQTAVTNEADSISDMINRIEANRKTFNTIKADTGYSLRQINAAKNTEFNSIRRDINNRPYTDGEMINGQVIPSVKQGRELEIKNKQASVEAVYKEQADAVYSAAFSKLSQVSDYAQQYINQLNSREFTLSSRDSEVSTTIDFYSPIINAWAGTANITIGDNTFKVYFTIPYRNWTEEAPLAQGDINYSSYLEKANDWTDILEQSQLYYEVIFTFKVEASAENSDYIFSFNQYSIKRADRLSPIYAAEINQKETVELTPSVSVLDFRVAGDSLIDYSEYAYSRQEEATDNSSSDAELKAFDPDYNPFEENSKESRRKNKNKSSSERFNLNLIVPVTALVNYKTNSFSDMDVRLGAQFYFNSGLDNLFFLADVTAGQIVSDELFNPVIINIGGGVAYIAPLSSYFYPYASLKGGVTVPCWMTKTGQQEDQGKMNPYFQLDLGFNIVIPDKMFGLQIAGSAAYIDKGFRYGATVSLIVDIL